MSSPPIERLGQFDAHGLLTYGQPIETRYTLLIARLWSTLASSSPSGLQASYISCFAPLSSTIDPLSPAQIQQHLASAKIEVAYVEMETASSLSFGFNMKAHALYDNLIFMSASWLHWIEEAVSSEDQDWFWLLGFAYFTVFCHELAHQQRERVSHAYTSVTVH